MWREKTELTQLVECMPFKHMVMGSSPIFGIWEKNIFFINYLKTICYVICIAPYSN